ncbi:hypothetical protein ACIP39_16985 [Streptomyces tibetensis]|uniref:hypothetical protein n=1 Tax=Streptomyces tibetensis TaxID=2382123 RepID=UPI0037F4152D
MRKYQKAAVVVAMLGSVSFLGAGVGHASDGHKVKVENEQDQSCSQSESITGGLIAAEDVLVGINVLGVQSNDQSERESNQCSQAFAFGGK